MPDPTSLYPKAPDPNAQNGLLNPRNALDLMGSIINLQKGSSELNSRTAIGREYQNALQPGGGVDFDALSRGLKSNPAAAYGLPEATTHILNQQGTTIQNATSLFEQRAKQNQFIMDGLGTLADKPNPSMEDVHRFIVTAAKNSNVPSWMLNAWSNGLPRDPSKLKESLVTMRNMAIGSGGTSVPDVTGYGPDGQPISGTRGQAGYERAGVGAPAAPAAPRAPGIPGLRPGFVESAQEESQTGAKTASALQTAANEIPAQRAQLDLMRKYTAQLEGKLGPMADLERRGNILVNRVTGTTATMSPDEIAAVEGFEKATNQMSLGQANAMRATDQGLHTALGATPNPAISALGNKGLIDVWHGNLDAIATKAAAWNRARASGVGPDKHFQWSDDFNRKVDPRVFQYMRMSKESRDKFVAQIADKSDFEKNLIDADVRGWIKLPSGVIDKDVREKIRKSLLSDPSERTLFHPDALK